jgi:hypothetical protein
VVGKSACDSIPKSVGIDVRNIGSVPKSPPLVLG